MEKKRYLETKALVSKILKVKNDNHLTYEAMGNALDVDGAHIYRIVSFKNSPSYEFLNKLARYMNIPLYTLFIPSEEQIREHYAELIMNRLEEMNLDIAEVAARTSIDLERIKGICSKTTTPTKDELNKIFVMLNIDEVPFYTCDDKVLSLIHLCTESSLEIEEKKHMIEHIMQ